MLIDLKEGLSRYTTTCFQKRSYDLCQLISHVCQINLEVLVLKLIAGPGRSAAMCRRQFQDEPPS